MVWLAQSNSFGTKFPNSQREGERESIGRSRKWRTSRNRRSQPHDSSRRFVMARRSGKIAVNIAGNRSVGYARSSQVIIGSHNRVRTVFKTVLQSRPPRTKLFNKPLLILIIIFVLLLLCGYWQTTAQTSDQGLAPSSKRPTPSRLPNG